MAWLELAMERCQFSGRYGAIRCQAALESSSPRHGLCTTVREKAISSKKPQISPGIREGPST